MKEEYVAGNTCWSELSFERFLLSLLKLSLGTNFILITCIPSLCQNVALKQDQLELFGFQFSHGTHRKICYLNPCFRDLCHVLWSCSLDIECCHSSWGRENRGFPFSHPRNLYKCHRSFMWKQINFSFSSTLSASDQLDTLVTCPTKIIVWYLWEA